MNKELEVENKIHEVGGTSLVWPDKYGIMRTVIKDWCVKFVFPRHTCIKENFYHITVTLSRREMKHKSYSQPLSSQ